VSRSSRRRGLLLMAAGAAVLVLGAGALVLVQRAPDAWDVARRPALAPSADSRAAGFETALAAAIHQVRGPEPWAIAIDPVDLNAWFARRWRPWADFAGDSIPDDLRRRPLEHVAVAVESEGELVLMLSRQGRVDWCSLEVVGEPGSVGLALTGVGAGSLPLPVVVAGGLAGELASFGGGLPALKLTDGRTVRVLDLAFQDGTVVVQCRTEPAAR
jgi:hypothetical protein